MGAQENKKSAQEAYAAFAGGDAEGAMRDIDDSIVWTVRGDNAITGTYRGKQEVGGMWGQYLSKSPQTKAHDFIAEGDRVVALVTVTTDGEAVETADVLTYSEEGKLVGFDSLGDQTLANRLYPK